MPAWGTARLICFILNDSEAINSSIISLEFVLECLYFYHELLVLLYADDTVIFGTNETSFKKNLDILYEYAKRWKLDINYDNTKILIFDTSNDDRFSFKMGESKISIC